VPVRTDRTKARWYRRDDVRRLRLRLPCAAISAVTRRIRKAGLRTAEVGGAATQVAASSIITRYANCQGSEGDGEVTRERLSLNTSALDRVATAETAVAGGRPDPQSAPRRSPEAHQGQDGHAAEEPR